MPSDAGFRIFIEFILVLPLLPHLEKEKGSTESHLKTFDAGNTIEIIVITILQSRLTTVAIHCVLWFHTYLLVPNQGCSRAVFSSR